MKKIKDMERWVQILAVSKYGIEILNLTCEQANDLIDTANTDYWPNLFHCFTKKLNYKKYLNKKGIIMKEIILVLAIMMMLGGCDTGNPAKWESDTSSSIKFVSFDAWSNPEERKEVIVGAYRLKLLMNFASRLKECEGKRIYIHNGEEYHQECNLIGVENQEIKEYNGMWLCDECLKTMQNEICNLKEAQ